MAVEKTVQKPRNWQDFESLCKRIFRHEWPCPTIKKNGRSGQPQHGVDIYGVPAGEDAYWGVQCKGKDDYAQTRLTPEEVDEEIKKARAFKPPLDVFIIATSANKDASLEEHVRKADLQSRQGGGFRVVLYCWEDLADLIYDHKPVWNYWIRDRQHRQAFDIRFGFSAEDPDCIAIRPKYRRVTKVVRRENEGRYDLSLGVRGIGPLDRVGALTRKLNASSVQLANSGAAGRAVSVAMGLTRSLSWCDVPFVLTNTGQEVLEDYRVELEILSDEFRLSEGLSSMVSPEVRQKHPVRTRGTRFASYTAANPLVQSDQQRFAVWIKSPPEPMEVDVEWKLYARDFDRVGVLRLVSRPCLEDVSETSTTRDPNLVGTTVQIAEAYEDDNSEG